MYLRPFFRGGHARAQPPLPFSPTLADGFGWVTLQQAHDVGRQGWLGANLLRPVASTPGHRHSFGVRRLVDTAIRIPTYAHVADGGWRVFSGAEATLAVTPFVNGHLVWVMVLWHGCASR